MNLLFLASWYPDSPSSRNGLFIWQHAEAAAMDAKHSVALVAAISDASVKRMEVRKQAIHGVDHYITHYPVGGFGLVRAWRYLRALHAAVRHKEKTSGKSDLLVVNVLWRSGLLAWLYQLLFNRPYIIIEHWSGYLPEGQGYNGYYLKYFTRLIADRAERILAVSDYLATSMRSHGLMNRYHLLPNVVNTALFKPVAKKNGAVPAYLLHISNLAAEKNFGFVVAFWQTLRSRWPELELRVAGAFTTEDQQPYTVFQDIHWLGFQEGEQLAQLYQNASALCMPSRFETFSIVIAEALACGCPVLATDLPTFDFYKKAQHFHPLPAGDLKAWQDAFLKLTAMDDRNSDYEFIHNNFSKVKVSEKMLSIIEGMDL